MEEEEVIERRGGGGGSFGLDSAEQEERSSWPSGGIRFCFFRFFPVDIVSLAKKKAK